MSLSKKLHLGCGHIIKEGWVNHDMVKLPGVDVVHDLNRIPWPWENGEFDEVYFKDVLEHLPDTIKTLEEIYRITKQGSVIYIAVPYWNSWEAVTDPTHKAQFNEFTFQFFDPTHWRCKERPYYSTARFNIIKQGFYISLLKPYLKIPFIGRERVVFHPLSKKILGLLATYFSNVIIGLEVYLKRD